MSSFWSIWITVIVLGSIYGCWWLLQSNSKIEKNPGDGDEAPKTGHVYDDIEEYDNPMPRWWYFKFIGLIIFALIYLALYPGLGSFKGLLGWTQESAVAEDIAEAKEKYGPIFAAYAAKSLEELQSDKKALLSGQRLFANNCAICHGSTAGGSYGFPNLTDEDWLYGGSPETIKATIMHGRQGQMPAWGTVLGEEGVSNVAEYVMSLGDNGELNADMVAKGETTFKTMCAACHGAEGKGTQALGAPNLTDDIWLYDRPGLSVKESVKLSITNGRAGVMPAHKELLGEDKSHLMAAYVYSLRKQSAK